MATRITEGLRLRDALTNIQRVQGRFERAQNVAAGGRKLQQFSDDLVNGERYLSAVNDLITSRRRGENIALAKDRLQQFDAALQDMNTVLTRARELAIQGANDTYSIQGRTDIAREVESLREQLVSIGNRNFAGEFLFGGFLSGTAPFANDGTFSGDLNVREVDIGQGLTVKVGVDAETAFGAVPGTVSGLFEALATLRDALLANDGIGARNALDDLDVGQDRFSHAEEQIGTRIERLQIANDVRGQLEILLQTKKADASEADAFQAFAELAQVENVLTAALQVSARTLNLPNLNRFLG